MSDRRREGPNQTTARHQANFLANKSESDKDREVLRNAKARQASLKLTSNHVFGLSITPNKNKNKNFRPISYNFGEGNKKGRYLTTSSLYDTGSSLCVTARSYKNIDRTKCEVIPVGLAANEAVMGRIVGPMKFFGYDMRGNRLDTPIYVENVVEIENANRDLISGAQLLDVGTNANVRRQGVYMRSQQYPHQIVMCANRVENFFQMKYDIDLNFDCDGASLDLNYGDPCQVVSEHDSINQNGPHFPLPSHHLTPRNEKIKRNDYGTDHRISNEDFRKNNSRNFDVQDPKDFYRRRNDGDRKLFDGLNTNREYQTFQPREITYPKRIFENSNNLRSPNQRAPRKINEGGGKVSELDSLDGQYGQTVANHYERMQDFNSELRDGELRSPFSGLRTSCGGEGVDSREDAHTQEDFVDGNRDKNKKSVEVFWDEEKKWSDRFFELEENQIKENEDFNEIVINEDEVNGSDVLRGLKDEACVIASDPSISLHYEDIRDEANVTKVNVNLLHKRLGHVPIDKIMKMYKNKTVMGPQIEGKRDPFCQVCLECKMRRTTYKRVNKPHVFQKLDMVAIDILGPCNVPSLMGGRYALLAIDLGTRRIFSYILREKSEATELLINLFTQMERESGIRLKAVLTDHGGEFLSGKLEDYLKKNGIRHGLSLTRTPERNSIIERSIGTIKNITRCLLREGNLPPIFWGIALTEAVAMYNTFETKGLGPGKCPIGVWGNFVPTVNIFKRFGSLAFGRINPLNRAHKFSVVSKAYFYLGYCFQQKGFRLYDPQYHKIVVTADVKIVESINANDYFRGQGASVWCMGGGDCPSNNQFYYDDSTESDNGRVQPITKAVTVTPPGSPPPVVPPNQSPPAGGSGSSNIVQPQANYANGVMGSPGKLTDSDSTTVDNASDEEERVLRDLRKGIGGRPKTSRPSQRPTRDRKPIKRLGIND